MNKFLSVEEALSSLSKIANVLKAGGVIAVPTDTIYGVACLARNKEALRRIYEIKRRDTAKPLAVSVGKVNDLEKWAEITIRDDDLKSLLPGPVTLVFDRKDSLPKDLNPGTTSIGLRIPNNKFMIELATECDEPIALTSANISNDASSLKIEEFKVIWDELDVIVDGGSLSDNLEAKAGSTVIDLTVKGTYKIIRNGNNYYKVKRILDEVCRLEMR